MIDWKSLGISAVLGLVLIGVVSSLLSASVLLIPSQPVEMNLILVKLFLLFCVSGAFLGIILGQIIKRLVVGGAAK